jgi:multiple antibiotic resistance protein
LSLLRRACLYVTVSAMNLSDLLSFSLLSLSSVFFIVNPIGAAPVFLALTDGWSSQDRVKAARRAVFVSGGVLLVFALTGSLLFQLFGVTLGAFRLAGGLLLLRVAMDMLHGRSSDTKITVEDHREAADKEDIGITPLGIPQLAGPGAIATVTLLPGEPREWWRIGPVLVAIVITIAVAYLLLRAAEKVQRVLGKTGTRILTKIMGLLIAAVGVQFMALGIRDLLPLIMQTSNG